MGVALKRNRNEWQRDDLGQVLTKVAPKWARPAKSESQQLHGTTTCITLWLPHHKKKTPLLTLSSLQKANTAHKTVESREDDPREKFSRLVAAWRDTVRGQSFAAQIAMQTSYQSMIGMGKEALPLIFERLKDEDEKPGYWFWALAAITEENPVPKESRGRISEMKNAWLTWGRERGYVELG